MPDAPLTLLVIDDEPQIRRLLRHALADADPESGAARVLEAATGREGIDLAAAEAPALVVLDLGLPDLAGIDVCREIRRWSSAPILVLSARHADTEKAALLDAGADDYLTKPFSPVELRARVRALLRRARAAAPPAADAVVRFGDLSVDLRLRRVERAGRPLHLTPTEWALLKALLAHPRRTLTHRQLFAAVWGNAEGDAPQYLRVYVGHLRRKLEADPIRPRHIQTEPGVGYRFEPDGVTPA
ncbi:response regulator [Roseisolibacter sp. H3M3-2]|uniref:response regulator n=1 Tax=Roseisolibacter sp. H3M3-2 TaxID=3031323 RepID=UPI0023DB1DFD|nr:response regulator [Roseisolibacter sp. H3M3-2]MDF1504009.1 response regulator [Roseisolibacter sp. H3M3-2]